MLQRYTSIRQNLIYFNMTGGSASYGSVGAATTTVSVLTQEEYVAREGANASTIAE